MTFEWDPVKATNLRKHRIAFEDAATAFLDPLAITFSDPDHSLEENREITIVKKHLCWFPIANARSGFVSVARVLQHRPSENSMKKKESEAKRSDDLQPEYDLSQLQGGVRGKYFHRASAGTNLVLIEPDLARVFPDTEAVNRALRVLADAAQTATTPKRRRSRSS